MPTTDRQPDSIGRLIFPDTLEVLYYTRNEDIREREHGSIWHYLDKYLDRYTENPVYYVYTRTDSFHASWEDSPLDQLPPQVQALLALIN